MTALVWMDAIAFVASILLVMKLSAEQYDQREASSLLLMTMRGGIIEERHTPGHLSDEQKQQQQQ